MIDRMATLRTGFKVTRASGADSLYELSIKFQSLEDLDAADQELRDALEREKAHEGPLVGDQIPGSRFAELHEPSGETEAPIVGPQSADGLMTTLREEFEALMPEPAGYILHWPAGEGSTRELFYRSRVAADAIGCKASPLYTADQVREARKAVAERCAVLCDTIAASEQAMHNTQAEQAADACAAAIRAQTGGDHDR